MIFQEYHKTVQPDGLTIISEYIPSVRSISLGVWVKTGSRLETRSSNGSAHFLEHMMFKGTPSRTPRQIVRSLESLGGNINAFTSKEQTCYYVEILDEHLTPAIEVLADITCHSTFPDNEFHKEKEVILDEIQSLEESPDELIHDYFIENLFPGHELGFPVMGTRESVQELTREMLLNFYQRHYRSKNIIIAAAGNVHHEELLSLSQRYFEFPPGNGELVKTPPHRINHGKFHFRKSNQQSHVCMGVPGMAYSASRRYQILLLNTILGGGMGSRLFQNIREAYGLAYGIYSFVDFYYDQGIIAAYLATDPQKMKQAVSLLEEEFGKLREETLAVQEIQEAKSQLKGNLVLGLESTSSRMNRLAMMEMYLGELYPIDRTLEEIDRITPESLQDTAKELFDPGKILQVVFSP